MLLELQIGVGVGFLGPGAALGVNLRKLERPPLRLATLLAFAPPSKTPAWRGGYFLKKQKPGLHPPTRRGSHLEESPAQGRDIETSRSRGL